MSLVPVGLLASNGDSKMKLVYRIDKPNDHPLHEVAKRLGITKSGYVAPKLIRNPRTLEVFRDGLIAEYDRLDSTLPPGIPLVVNLEHFRIIKQPDGDWPLSAYDWLQTHHSVAIHMRGRHVNRLVGEWGLRIGKNKDLNKLYRNNWTCGILSVYRRASWSYKGWVRLVMSHYKKTARVGKPIQIDMAPVIWQSSGASKNEARAAMGQEWLQMLSITKKMNPRWAGLWLRDGIQGVTDEFIERSMRLMVSELGN